MADLAFRGKTDRYYRQLAILTAGYYGKPDVTWKESMLFLERVAAECNSHSCDNVIEDVNYYLNYVKEDFVERPEQLELSEQNKKSLISYRDWLDKKKMEEWNSWYDYAHNLTRDPHSYRTDNET